jgi:hypothetical protein
MRSDGESSVCGSDGRQSLKTTLAEPGTLLLGDVLVITFASR